MKFRILSIIFIIILDLSINAQDYFKAGLYYFNKGNYFLADSCFTLQLQMSPSDRNAKFNRGLMRLFIKDTCSFCNDMSDLFHSLNDTTAKKLYFTFCAKSDTIFYDKNYLPIINEDKHRFYEVIEHSRCKNYVYGEVHDKKENGGKYLIRSNSAFPYIFQDDEIGIYYSYGDTLKVYSFTKTPAAFQGDEEARLYYIHNSPYFKQAMNDLKLHHVIVDVEFTVNKIGRIKDVRIIDIKPRIEREEELSNFTKLIFINMPPYKPAKFRDENVDSYLWEYISFW